MLQLVISFLQTLINHKNAALANVSRKAYIVLLSYCSKFDFVDNARSEFLESTTNFLMTTLNREYSTPKDISFCLESLSNLVPVSLIFLISFYSQSCAFYFDIPFPLQFFEKHPSAVDSTRVHLKMVNEIVRLVEDITSAPMPPKAYRLPELISSMVNLLAVASVSQQLRKSLWRSLKLALIACFEAYPRLSPNATDSIVYAIFDAIHTLIDKKNFTSVLNEVCKS